MGQLDGNFAKRGLEVTVRHKLKRRQKKCLEHIGRQVSDWDAKKVSLTDL